MLSRTLLPLWLQVHGPQFIALNINIIVTQLMSTLPKIPDDEYLSVSKEGLEYILANFDPQVPDRNFLWTTDYRVELPVRVKKGGPGSEHPYTLVDMWREALVKYGQLGALTYETAPNQWRTLTYKQYYELAANFARSLIALGVGEYSAVNIIGYNSVEWAVAFYGSIFGHYLPIGLYTTNNPEACAYIANHSESQIVFMEDASHLRKYIQVAEQVRGIKHYVIWKGAVPADLPADFKGRVITWKEFMAFGEKNYKPAKKEDTLEWRMEVQKPGNCATFIYTSGTTGPPKAVMISHDNYTWVTDSICHIMKIDTPEKIGTGRLISLLPLSHVAAQLLDLVVSLRVGNNVFFTDPSALQGNLVKFLHACRPTTFLGVPRVWEKLQEGITAVDAQTTGLKRKIADWAKSIGPEGTYAEINGGPLPRGWSIAKKLVFDKIKANLGLDQCETFIFSAAPLKESTRLFFLHLNFYLVNIYGMSELSGPQTISNPKAFKNFHSIEALKEAGECFPGLELRIANPDPEGNGEICLRGRNTFMGYYKNEKETRETVDSKGFVHSGDVGVVGANKTLSITGRIKELLITAGGENVAPVLIENEITNALPLFSQVVVIGDKKKYLSCLLVLKVKSPGVLADEVVSYVKQHGSSASTVQEAAKCKNFLKAIQAGIDVANSKAISKAQHIQRFAILESEFSVDGGELTPTLKLKRKIINQKYETAINGMYEVPKL